MEAKINTSEMIKFYKEFDAVDFKYQLFLYEKDDENKLQPVSDYFERYKKYQKHEYAYQISELTKKNYAGVRANLDLVYAKREMTDKVIEIYELVMHKLINQYINIDGIERMFSEKYVDFEWDMHLGIDYNKHSMNFYRDHFIHQVRNAYMMHMLLEDGYEQYVAEVLQNEANGKISRFVYKHLLQQEEVVDTILDPECTYAEDSVRSHYLKNIIYMSCYMAALFHDIGYPEVANMINRRRITDYISNIYNLETNYCDFNKISTLLQNSLLFRVVSVEEIRTKIEGSKPDHGALSAIIFLMHFYENGAIHRLEPYKLCAVELAGLAIYNHTAKYMHGNKKLSKEEAAYYKSSFLLNPISYLLRLCDDLQEWDRIYFEISNSSNLIVCNKCKTPIVRVQNNDGVFYRCNCNSIEAEHRNTEIQYNGVFQPIFKYGAFPYRRIYNVTVCENLLWYTKNGKLVFELKYDLENLLHVAYINSSYAKYRIQELNQVKYLFEYQAIIPKMVVEYFVSANPVLIKVKILEQWLTCKHAIVLSDWWKNFANTMQSTDEKKAIFEDIQKQFTLARTNCAIQFDDIYNCEMDGCYREKLKRYMEKAVELYQSLSWFLYLYQKVNVECLSLNTEMAKNILEDLSSAFQREIQKDAFYSADAMCLINDCFTQFRRMYDDVSRLDYLPEEYYQQFQEDDDDKNSLYACCDSFACAKAYVPINERSELELDAFTDLYMFHRMAKELSGCKERQ